ncbi:MAG: hypothetical protein JWO69_469, partial [Thermoleophilia bacterium]|nr:hypothetical protein [Thermoleophilia bacterium]
AAAANVSGGGVVEDAKAMIEQSFGSLTEMAQFRMTSLENQMDAEMKSKGTLDAATIQKYTNKMTSFEMIMQLAAKLQESKDNAIRAWLNR